MADFLFAPVSHDEAVDFIASKPVLSRAVFDRLLPELRARAFTITGVNAADAVQAIRDRIADLPAGATWDAVKKDLVRKISVHFIDPDADAQERDKQLNASNRRAELLLRTQGFQAYQTSAYSRMAEQKDVLPYWQYVTMGDGRVRHTHAALNGIVLPAGSPFWNTHFPPWDFGCRCQCVPLSKEDHADIKAADADKAPDQQRIIEGPALRELEQGNRLSRGPTQVVNVSPPSGPNAYHWHPGDVDLDATQLRTRYDAQTFGDFERWARGAEVSKGKTVWQWIGGEATPPPGKPGGEMVVVPPKPLVPVAPAAPAATVTKPAAPATVADLLKRVGLDKGGAATPAQMKALKAALAKEAPVKVGTLNRIISIDKPAAYKNLTADRLRALTQSFIAMLPPAVAKQLPEFELQVKQRLPGALGDYNEATKVLRLNGGALDGDPDRVQKTLWHEMTHWAHDHGPAEFRARIETLFAARTNGFTDKRAKLKPFNSSKVTGFDDDFLDANGDEYAGRVYPWEIGKPRGNEIATRHLEKLAVSDAELAGHWNYQSAKTGNFAWREAFTECLNLFFASPSSGPTTPPPAAP